MILVVAELIEIFPENAFMNKIATILMEALGIHDFCALSKFVSDVLTEAVFTNHVATVAHRENFVRLTLTVAAWTIEALYFLFLIRPNKFEIEFVLEK